MAPMPPITASTVTAIWAAWEVEAKSWDSVGISMSELGSDCDRALWFAFRWASAAEKMTGQKLRRFETGHIEEARMISDLRRVPDVTVYDVDPERIGRDGKPAQFKVYSHNGHVRGKLDGKVIGLPEAPKKLHCLECKSHNDKNFKELVKKGVKASKRAHWLQCQKYMQIEGLDRCLYMAVNKDTDELYSERIEYDMAEVLKMDARLERIIVSPKAPPRIADGPTKYPCIICRHSDACHGNAFGRQSCRTCIHATPIMGDGKDAPWRCEKFNKFLTLDEQRAGCHAHLFLPDVVPGEQVDAGEDWISYVMRDGQTWVDQEKKPAAEPEARPLPHDVYKTGDADAPEVVKDRNGDVVLELCRSCGRGERELNEGPCDGVPLPEPVLPKRYFWHAESSRLYTQDDGCIPGIPGIEELSAEEFAEAQAHFAKVPAQ